MPRGWDGRSASSALRQGRVAQSDELVQGARHVGGRHARRARSGAPVLAVPTAGNAGNALAAYAAQAGLEAKVFMPRDAKRPFVLECELYGADVTLVDGLITDAGRLAAEQGGAARLVRRVDAQGALPDRGQEDDGLRDGGAARLEAAGLDRVSDGRRHRPHRHVESVRRDGGARLDRRRAAAAHGERAGGTAARPSSARSSAARSGPRSGGMRPRSPTGCACRRRLATF